MVGVDTFACVKRLRGVENDIQSTKQALLKSVDLVMDSVQTVIEDALEINSMSLLLSEREKEINDQAAVIQSAKQYFETRQISMINEATKVKDIIKLNVGGTIFETSKETLMKENDTFFHALLRHGVWEPDDGDAYFIDRSPKWFELILEYLRESNVHVRLEGLTLEDRDRLLLEAEFYQITSLLWRLRGGPNAMTGMITTIAGNGLRGYSGDNGPAACAALYRPCGICTYKNELFIADCYNHCVRAVDLSTGVIRTVAGIAEKGNDGDGGLAVNAKLDCPIRVAAWKGILYIADRDAGRIRQVDLETGIINTTVGAVGGLAAAMQGYVSDGSDARLAKLHCPVGICVQNDALYIADIGSYRIRMVNLLTGTIATVAGTGELGHWGDGSKGINAQLDTPCDLTVSGTNLYISDSGNECIRVLDLTTGIIDTLAGCRPTANRKLPLIQGHPKNQPSEATDNNTKKCTDKGSNNNCVLQLPYGLAAHNGYLYVVCSRSHTICKVDMSDGAASYFCGVNGEAGFKGDGGPPSDALLNRPIGVAIADDKLFISDQLNHRVRVIGL